MRPGDKCPDCGSEGKYTTGAFGMTRYQCKNGCDTKRLNQIRSENAKRYWANRRDKLEIQEDR